MAGRSSCPSAGWRRCCGTASGSHEVFLQVIPKFEQRLYPIGHVIEIRMRVGPKGQVVIPKVLRDALRIGPGSVVTFSLEDEKVVLRASRGDAVGGFERVARPGGVFGGVGDGWGAPAAHRARAETVSA